MALKLDNTLLEELGLGALPDAEKQLLLRQIYEKLEMNVGMRLADQMSNEQLDAFEKFVDANDDKGAFQWLEQNFPNYKMVVNEEFEKLKNEIRTVAPQILATASQQQAAAGGAPQAHGPAPAQDQPGPAPLPAQQPPQHQPHPQQHDQPQPQAPQFQPQPGANPYAPQPPGQGYPQPQQFTPPQPAPQSPYPPASPPPPMPPPVSGAMPQNGHLQPQYGGTPSFQPQPGPADNQGGNPAYPSHQDYQGHQQPPQAPGQQQ